MKVYFGHQQAGSRSANSSLLCRLLLGVLGALAGTAILVSAIFPGKNGPVVVLASRVGLFGTNAPGGLHFPKGQLKADAHSLLAALRWLIEPDALYPVEPANQTESAWAASNSSSPVLVPKTLASPLVLSADPSNTPAPTNGLITNQPSSI